VDVHVKDALMTCPSCGKTFRVEEHQQAQTTAPPAVASAPCPPQVPAPVMAAGAQAAVAAAAQVAAPAPTPETPGEVIHLAMFRRYPFRCLGYILLIVVGIVGLIEGVNLGWHWLTLLGSAVALIVAAKFFHWWLRMSRTTLTITNKRGILSTGIFTQEHLEFELSKIIDLHVHQTLLMRWLSVGDIAVVTSTTGQQIVIMAVPDAVMVAEHMQTHSDREKKAAEQPDTVVVQQPIVAGNVPTPQG
jgi:uncharacterized membrane protein YdbT with pleckstrin-like domain